MATFPFNKKKIFYVRVKSATIRHLLSRQESPLPIKLLTLSVISLYSQLDLNQCKSGGNRVVYH